MEWIFQIPLSAHESTTIYLNQWYNLCTVNNLFDCTGNFEEWWLQRRNDGEQFNHLNSLHGKYIVIIKGISDS